MTEYKITSDCNNNINNEIVIDNIFFENVIVKTKGLDNTDSIKPKEDNCHNNIIQHSQDNSPDVIPTTANLLDNKTNIKDDKMCKLHLHPVINNTSMSTSEKLSIAENLILNTQIATIDKLASITNSHAPANPRFETCACEANIYLPSLPESYKESTFIHENMNNDGDHNTNLNVQSYDTVLASLNSLPMPLNNNSDEYNDNFCNADYQTNIVPNSNKHINCIQSTFEHNFERCERNFPLHYSTRHVPCYDLRKDVDLVYDSSVGFIKIGDAEKIKENISKQYPNIKITFDNIILDLKVLINADIITEHIVSDKKFVKIEYNNREITINNVDLNAIKQILQLKF